MRNSYGRSLSCRTCWLSRWSRKNISACTVAIEIWFKIEMLVSSYMKFDYGAGQRWNILLHLGRVIRLQITSLYVKQILVLQHLESTRRQQIYSILLRKLLLLKHMIISGTATVLMSFIAIQRHYAEAAQPESSAREWIHCVCGLLLEDWFNILLFGSLRNVWCMGR